MKCFVAILFALLIGLLPSEATAREGPGRRLLRFPGPDNLQIEIIGAE